MQLHKREKLKKLSETAAVDLEKRFVEIAGQMSCPIHNERATVWITGKDLATLQIHVAGCCDEFVRRVRENLRT